MKMISSLLTRSASAIIAAFVGSVICALVFGVYLGLETASFNSPPITQPAPRVLTVQVPIPALTEKVITKYIPTEYQPETRALIKENETLKLKLKELSVSSAETSTTSSGTIVFAMTPPDSSTPTFTFRDWRLSFQGIGNTATYTLSQKFAIVNSVSTDRFGVPTQLIRLYEVGPNKERWPIPVTETTTVAATTPPEGWYTKASIQGGWSPQPSSPGGIILALPWLKHGKTQAIENTRWAFITPAARLNDKEITLGIFPVSVNLGTFRYQPFSDLWVSPFVGIDPKTRNTQIGGAISVTF